MTPNSRILFSNISKRDQIWPGGEVVPNVNLGNICNDDISCTMFEKIDIPFRFRAEQCVEMLYVLMIYPNSNPNPNVKMSISGEYIDETPCYTISGGIHEIVSSDTICGIRTDEECESTVRCSLIKCKYQGEAKSEAVCLPRIINEAAREEYWARSGLILTDYGNLPLDTYGPFTMIIIVVVIFLMTCFCAGWYYNLRIYQNKKPPFSVPKFCPQWCFPQPREDYNNRSFDDADSGSFDVLDQNREGTRRGTTKYRAPQFYFEDE